VSSEPFIHKRLILVEGPGDAGFLRNLIRKRTLPDHFDIRTPKESGISGSGNTRFGEALDAFVLVPGFPLVRKILIVSDNDDDPRNAFRQIRLQIRKTSRKYKAPTRRLSATTGSPSLTIMMLPSTRKRGNLERLCWDAAVKQTANAQVVACANEFARCAGIDNWSSGKLAKVKIRSLIASKYQRNCDESLAFLWDDYPDLIPLSDPVFDPIANFLATF